MGVGYDKLEVQQQKLIKCTLCEVSGRKKRNISSYLDHSFTQVLEHRPNTGLWRECRRTSFSDSIEKHEKTLQGNKRK